MKKQLKKLLSCILILCITLLALMPIYMQTLVDAKVKTKLSTKSITMTVGDTKTIKLLNSKKGAVWSRENEHIKILSETKKQVKIKAIEDGTSKVYANVGKKEYICKIIIKKKKFPKNTATPKPTIEPTIVTTDKPIPTVTPTLKPSIVPTVTQTPVPKNKLLYKDENVSITYTGISGEEKYYNVNFLIENTSGKTLVIQVRETSINGFMVSPICSMEVAPNKKTEDSMKILGKDAERTSMSKVENIETKFHIFNDNDWSDSYDTKNIIIMSNLCDSTDNNINQPTSTPIVNPTTSPTIAPVATPKPVVTPKPIITPNSNSFNSSEAEKNVKKEVRIINNKIVVFLENNYSMPVSIQSDCYFYDEKENVVDTGYSYLFQIEPNMKGALIFNETKEEYSSYKLKYDFFQSFAYINNKSILGDIKLKSNDIISDGEVSGIALTIMNQSNFDCACCTFLVNFYDDFGNIVDTKMETEYDIKRKEKEVAEITLPYNSRTYENIKYSSYEILLSTAYY